ncbi:MAG: ABC transporter ATP-binding protein [Sedimentisphaerales bacterium]|nr:ABC transporter ATP-binding protein [Sedimentisphaerales bacterium]
MSQTAIKVQNVGKNFGKVCAVQDLSFDVAANTCFGLLGPNGAGKTTMMKIIYGKCTLDNSNGSCVNVFGYNPVTDELAIKYLSGVVPQDDNLDDELNVVQNLRIYAKFYALSAKNTNERIKYLLDFLELTEKRKASIKHLSGGMKRRLIIARALLNNPKLLILDEPTTGLDPQVRHLIWDKLRQLKKQGTTILLTTHYMEEAFALCDAVLIMDRGREVIQGTPAELLERNIEKFVLELTGSHAISDIEEPVKTGIRVDRGQESTRLYSNDADRLKRLAAKLEGAHYFLRQTNLEDVFLKATGRELNEKQ